MFVKSNFVLMYNNLNRIIKELSDAGMPNVEPNVNSYSILIETYAKMNCVEGAIHAEHLVDEMQQNNLMPDKVTMTSVMKAWCRSGDENAAFKVEAILNNMLENYDKNKSLKPDRICFKTVIDSFRRKGGRESFAKAKKIEKMMKALT